MTSFVITVGVLYFVCLQLDRGNVWQAYRVHVADMLQISRTPFPFFLWPFILFDLKLT